MQSISLKGHASNKRPTLTLKRTVFIINARAFIRIITVISEDINVP